MNSIKVVFIHTKTNFGVLFYISCPRLIGYLSTMSIDKQTLVCKAIRDKSLIRFYYESKSSSEFRTVEPYILGYHIDTGNVVLRAWCLGTTNDWRMYELDEMDEIGVLEEVFTSIRQSYDLVDDKINPIICQVLR